MGQPCTGGVKGVHGWVKGVPGYIKGYLVTYGGRGSNGLVERGIPMYWMVTQCALSFRLGLSAGVLLRSPKHPPFIILILG